MIENQALLRDDKETPTKAENKKVIAVINDFKPPTPKSPMKPMLLNNNSSVATSVEVF